MTAVTKFEEVVEELADICGANIVFEAKFANAPAQVDPDILFVEHSEILPDLLEELEAIVMEGRGLHLFAAQQLAHTLVHFFGGIEGIGKGEDLMRLGVPFVDQPLDAMSQDGGFARASAGHHQHRPMDMLDGFALAIVWK